MFCGQIKINYFYGHFPIANCKFTRGDIHSYPKIIPLLSYYCGMIIPWLSQLCWFTRGYVFNLPSGIIPIIPYNPYSLLIIPGHGHPHFILIQTSPPKFLTHLELLQHLPRSPVLPRVVHHAMTWLCFRQKKRDAYEIMMSNGWLMVNNGVYWWWVVIIGWLVGD